MALMEDAMETRYIGTDAYATPRVFGCGLTAELAETECWEAAREYVARRPDTGPLSEWTVDKEK